MAFIPPGTGYDNRAFDTKRAKPLQKRCERCNVLLRWAQKRYCKPCSMDVAAVNNDRRAKERAARRQAAKLAEREAEETAKGWKCEAWADEEAPCEWPLCGCDPDASKVIAAIEECFTLTPKVGRRRRFEEPSPTPDAAFLLGDGELPADLG